MKSCEPFVNRSSDYYVHSPSVTARRMFFYPICVGHFVYDPGYRLERDKYDSFLVELIQKGEFTLETKGQKYTAREGIVVLVDCFSPH